MIVNSLQEFYSFFKINKPLLSIDYGTKKLGLAVSTLNHSLAIPHSVIVTNNEKEKIHRIISFVMQHNICAIIVGLPINMDGTKGTQSKIVNNFVKKLSNKTKLSIYLQDERFTSRAADVFFKNMGLNRKERNKRNDMAAASMILETTLESVKRLGLN